MFEDIKSSPVGRSLLAFANEGKLNTEMTEHLFDADSLLFPEPNFTKLETDDEKASLKIAQLSVLYVFGYSTWHDLIDAFQLCESPIERHFLAALIAIAKDDWIDIMIHGHERTYLDTPKSWKGILHVYPQKDIGEYRVDFLLVFQGSELIKTEDSKLPGKPERKEFSLVVECDGHDFHEKTKEQASRDKERDRILQSCGYNVFRFSGSDLYRGALKCAEECFLFLQEKLWAKN